MLCQIRRLVEELRGSRLDVGNVRQPPDLRVIDQAMARLAKPEAWDRPQGLDVSLDGVLRILSARVVGNELDNDPAEFLTTLATGPPAPRRFVREFPDCALCLRQFQLFHSFPRIAWLAARSKSRQR